MHTTNSVEDTETGIVVGEAINAVQSLVRLSQELELPGPPDMLNTLQLKISKQEYTVLVAGEAKRGKSTFVNALIGRDLLPTDVEIATSQVFRVRTEERVNCRLRFEDNSAVEISETDLHQYGSQVAQGGRTPVQDERVLRWIEVETPTTFLPSGITLLDTPGVGSLYAGHAQITYRFVPHADAVIFVLDSERPILQSELDFIAKLLEVTPNIFFVQTKIDLFNAETWQLILQRNRMILEERFPDKFRNVTIAPISSTNLRYASDFSADEDRTALVNISRFSEMIQSLHEFLLETVTLRYTLQAIAIGAKFHEESRAVLHRRLSSLNDKTKDEQAQLQEQMKHRMQAFGAEWGEHGAKRQLLLSEVKKKIELGKLTFRQSIQPNGAISKELENELDQLRTLEGLNEFGKRLSGDVAARVVATWKQTCAQTEERCLELMEPFAQEATLLTAAPVYEDEWFEPPTSRFKGFNDDLWERIKLTQRDIFPVIGATSVAAVLGVSLLSTPLGWVVGAGVVFAAIRGWESAGQTRIEEARRDLRQLLHGELQKHWKTFFEVDGIAGRFSRVDEHYAQLDQAITSRVNELVQSKLEDVQTEIDLLQGDTRLRIEEQSTRLEALKRPLEEWERLRQQFVQLAQSHLQLVSRKTGVPANAQADPAD